MRVMFALPEPVCRRARPRPDEFRGYLHGHSALSRASSRVLVIPSFGGKAGYRRATLIPDRVLPVSSGDRAIRVSRAVAARRTGPPRVPVVGKGAAVGDHAAASIEGHVALLNFPACEREDVTCVVDVNILL